MTAFFNLSSPSEGRLAEWDKGPSYESVSCPATEGHRRAGRRIGDLRVVLPAPPLPDFIWTWASDLLVSDDTLSWLQSHNVSGFDVTPAAGRFRSKRAGSVPTLYEIVTTGWAGWVSKEAGVRLKTEEPCCGHRVYTTPHPSADLIDPNSWDGADLFMVWPLPMFRFVSERFARLLEAEERSGVSVTPANDLAWPRAIPSPRVACRTTCPPNGPRPWAVPLGSTDTPFEA